MKRNILIGLIFSMILLLTQNVNAAYMKSADIEDDSYVIGNYLFTRDTNTDAGYNGELTTKVMLLAAKSINGEELSDMKVYYKTFLGDWINGITGEAISDPVGFEIKNRNLKETIPTPDLDCVFQASSAANGQQTNVIKCTSSAVVDGELNYASTFAGSSYNKLTKISGVEFYMLRNSDNTLPEGIAYYDGYDRFRVGNSTTVYPVKICEGETEGCLGEYLYTFNLDPWDHPFYQIVSRLYYLDGEEKVYSSYSNIQTNGAVARFRIGETNVKLDATINTDYALKVNSSFGSYGPGINGEVNYYNVKFNLGNIDTTKYMIREYRVYSARSAFDETFNFDVNSQDYYQNAEGGDDVYEYLYLESVVKEKYKHARRLAGGLVDVYLIADVRGIDVFGESYLDMSGTSVYSKRLYWPDDVDNNESRAIVAKATICNLAQTECYEVSPRISSTTGNQSYVR